MNVLNRQNRRIQRKLANLKNLHPLWVRTVAGLAAVVMFFTVYSLILPAAAATGDQATEESGFFLEESAAETEAKELAEAEPASGGEAAQEAESPSGSSEEGSAVQQESSSGSGESSPSGRPETLQAETSGSGSGWESIPQDNAASADITKVNTDTSSSTASGSGQNGTEEFVVSEQEANKSTEAAAAVTEETVSETASQKTEATTEEITEETSEELSEETEEEEEEPVYTNTIETEDEKTGIKAKIVFDEEIVRDTDKLVLAAASDKKSDKEIVIPLDALEKGIAERCAEIVNKDLDDEEKKSADDIETVKAEFVGLTIEDKDGEEVSLPANTRMRVEIVFSGSYETEEEEYQCVLMAEQSAKDYQDQLEKKAADDELVVSMEKLKADVSEQDQADGGKTVVSFETKELNSAGIVVFRVIEDDVEDASSDESEVSEESSETSSEETSDESAETTEDVTDESSDEISESKETVSEDTLAEVSAESADEVTSESEEAASEEDETVYEAGTLKADGGDYHITMSYTEDAKIPAGARLEVRELQERTREFNKLIGQYNKEFPDAKVETESSSAVVRGLKKAGDAVTGFIGGLLGIEKAPEPTSVQNARLFDITILDKDEKPVEPCATVQVDIQLSELQSVASENDITLIHFEDSVSELDASLDGETLSFETDSFSVYGVVYTVDFEYTDPGSGETYKFTMPGGGTIMLSELVQTLGIIEDTDYAGVEEFMADVEKVEFSNESLVKVTAVDGDWELKSLQAFDTDETLTIVMKDGHEISVKVKDASEVLADDGIKSLLTGVTITGAKQDGDKYIVYPDQPYGVHLSFAEVNKANGQFPMGNSFTYQLPAGLMPYGSSVSNSLDIELSGGEHAGEIVKLNYTINDSGLITFTWDTATNPEAYQQLADALYAQFKLDIECTYTGDGGELDFGNDIKKEVEVKTNGTTNVYKKGRYNAVTNCVDYEVSINSDGVTKNVVITDTVSGSALTYNQDAVSSTSIYGKDVPSPVSTGNGFTLTIPQMADGETVIIKYSAAVNLDALHQNEDGSWGTFDETGNKVIVKSEGNPDVEKENYGKDFEHKISMSNISKSGIAAETDENGHATVNWTIRANDPANVSMAGHAIRDSIGGNSVPMTYNSAGIHVIAYNSDGTQAYEKDIAWGTDGLTKATDEKSWSWLVPNENPDSGKLTYVITYSTDADVSGRVIKTNVTNHAESDNGGSSDQGVDVTPYGGSLNAYKKVIKTDLAANTVTWEVSFDVPAAGLSSAKIDDTVPVYYNAAGTLVAVDNYLSEGTFTITPELEGDESYEISTTTDENGKEHVIIEFYKLDGSQKVTGLTGTGTARRIRVQFQTEIDSDWKQAAINNPNDSNALYHTNNAAVILNGQQIDTSANTRIDGSEPGMSKVHGQQDTYQISGNKLPAFPYVVTLQGITEDSFDDNGNLIIEDSFNGKYLAYYARSEDGKGDNEHIGRVFGADYFYDYQKGQSPIWNATQITKDSVITSPSDGKLIFTLNRDSIEKEDGGFYNYYYIYYYLTVKDPIALEKLAKEIQTSESGSYLLLNTVSNNKFGTATDTVEYDIPVLDKTITSPDGKAYYSNGNWMVDFKLDVNPDAVELGDDEELTLTDDYTNLAVDYTTIKIQKYVNGVPVDITDEDGVSWNRKGNRVTYTLKNGIHYVITYMARITGTPESDGKVHYNNTAEYFGVKKRAGGEQDIRSGGEGSSPTYGITVFKHEKGAGSTPLEGAKFKLYKYESTKEQEEGWRNQPSNEINTETRTPADTGWIEVKDMVSGADGVAKTAASDHIERWTWYMLVEQEAPVYEGSEHYQLKDFGYVFWITDKKAADYEHYVYLNDDVVAVDNEPPVPETVNIGVTKTWTNDSGDISKRKDITVRLCADGVPYDDWADKDGNHLTPRDDTVKTLSLMEDGTTESYIWYNLPGGPVYSVAEDGVAGYTTTYSSKGMQVSGSINIKNKYIPGKTFIHVEKVWNGIASKDQAEDITVQLKRKVSANATIQFVRYDGLYYYSTTVPAGSTINITYKVENSTNTEGYTIYEGLSTTGRIIAGQDTQWGGGDGSVCINGIKLSPKGITIQFPNDGFDWANLESIPTVTVVDSSGEDNYSDDINFNNENRYYTISAANNWEIDIDRLVKEDDDGKYIYYIEEVGVNDNTQTPEEAGFTVTYENNDGIEGGTGDSKQDTIKVTNSSDTGSLKVTKEVQGTDAKGTYRIAVKAADGHYYDINGGDQGTTAFYVEFAKDKAKTWSNLPVGSYTVEEDNAAAAGYTWTVTGTDKVITVNANETAELTVVNSYEEEPGSLKIEKLVRVDGKTPSTTGQKALTAGSYEFVIASKTLDPSVTKTVNITFGNDGTAISVSGDDVELQNGVVTVSGLKADDYTITESIPENGTSLISTTVAGQGSVSQDNVATITVTKGDIATVPTATFTNNAETTSIKVKKEWEDEKDHSNINIPFSVIQILPVSEAEHISTVYGSSYSVKGDGTVITIDDLPKYAVYNGTKIMCHYDIIEGDPGSEIQAAYTASRRTLDDGTLVMVNTPVSDKDTHTDVSVEKIWKEGNQTVTNTSDSITFRLERYAINTQFVPVMFTNNSRTLFDIPQAPSRTFYVPINSTFELEATKGNILGLESFYLSINGKAVEFDAWSRYKKELTITGPTKIDAGGWGVVSKAAPSSGTEYYNTPAELVEAKKSSGAAVKDGEYDYTYSYSSTEVTGTDGAPKATTTANSWEANLNELMEYEASSGKIYSYKITEIKINDDPVILSQTNDYTVSETETTTEEGTKTTITNTKKEHTELEVEKKWLNADGTEMETKPNAIAKFSLTQHIIGEDSKEITSRPYANSSNEGIYELKADNGWKQVFTALPKTGTYTYTPTGAEIATTVAVTYKYSVEEVEVQKPGPNTDIIDEFNVSYQFLVKGGTNPADASASYQIGESGKLTINNTTKYTAALPSTGGHGTKLFTSLGCMLIALAGVLAVRRRRVR